MPKIGTKQYQEPDVLEAAKERVRYCFKNFDKVVVSFSAGKDSTAVLHVAYAVAKEMGKLPLTVIFVDEEAIHPPTAEYAERVRQNPDFDFQWYCLPVMHRNACSNDEPYWYCWDESKRDLWVRDMPEHAIRTHPRFVQGQSFQEWMPAMYSPEVGRVCILMGIRTQESLRRYRAIAGRKHDVFLMNAAENKNSYRASPIYDWSSEDVWRLVEKWNLDYNRTYDIFNHTRFHGQLLRQRVCPPYGEEPLRGLWIYAECFPEMWHKMLYRVQGVATAWRYANTELWNNNKKPEHLSWREYFDVLVKNYDAEHQYLIKKSVNGLIGRHNDRTRDTIHDYLPHPVSGASWKFFCIIAQKGDFKGRQKQNMLGMGLAIRDKLGITLAEANQRYGRTGRKDSFMADIALLGAKAQDLEQPDTIDEEETISTND